LRACHAGSPCSAKRAGSAATRNASRVSWAAAWWCWPPRTLERQRHDHVGAKRAHHADHVAERLLPAPLREGLFDAERVAELVGAAEVLLDPVVAVERQQLARAQDAECFEQLRPDRVLPALATRDREQRRAQAEPAREPHQDPVVLVVGVRGHVQHAPGRTHAPQCEPQAGRAAIEIERLEGRGGRSWSGQERRGEDE
jgi:hypothetical protein